VSDSVCAAEEDIVRLIAGLCFRQLLNHGRLIAVLQIRSAWVFSPSDVVAELTDLDPLNAGFVILLFRGIVYAVLRECQLNGCARRSMGVLSDI